MRCYEYVYMCIFTCICIYSHGSVDTLNTSYDEVLWICIYVYIYMYMYIFTWICGYLKYIIWWGVMNMYIYMYIYMYMYIFTWICGYFEYIIWWGFIYMYIFAFIYPHGSVDSLNTSYDECFQFMYVKMSLSIYVYISTWIFDTSSRHEMEYTTKLSTPRNGVQTHSKPRINCEYSILYLQLFRDFVLHFVVYSISWCTPFRDGWTLNTSYDELYS
jgi:hypothetical protein